MDTLGIVNGGCSGGWSTPLCPGHKAYVNVKLLADSCMLTLAKILFVQAKIEPQSSSIGGVVTFWSMRISSYCIAAQESTFTFYLSTPPPPMKILATPLG